jgi:hypothetical protein
MHVNEVVLRRAVGTSKGTLGQTVIVTVKFSYHFTGELNFRQPFPQNVGLSTVA